MFPLPKKQEEKPLEGNGSVQMVLFTLPLFIDSFHFNKKDEYTAKDGSIEKDFFCADWQCSVKKYITLKGTEQEITFKGDHNHPPPTGRMRTNRLEPEEKKRLTEKLMNTHSVHSVVFCSSLFQLNRLSTWKK